MSYTTSIEDQLKNKDALPFYEFLNKNESVLSWIIRNSASNYISFDDFLKFHGLFKGKHFDYDLKFTKDEICKILSKSISTQKISYSPKDIYSNNGIEKYTSNVGTFKQVSINPLAYCPSCMDSDSPFMNIKWRSNFIYGCSVCGCYLTKNCPKCNRVIQLSKTTNYQFEYVKNPFTCSVCGIKFGTSPVEQLSKTELDNLIWLEELLFLDQSKNLSNQLIEALLLIVSKHKLGSHLREHFNISEYAGGYSVISNKGKSKIVEAVRYWLGNFNSTISLINEKYSLRMTHWKGKITITILLYNSILFADKFQ